MTSRRSGVRYRGPGGGTGMIPTGTLLATAAREHQQCLLNITFPMLLHDRCEQRERARRFFFSSTLLNSTT